MSGGVERSGIGSSSLSCVQSPSASRGTPHKRRIESAVSTVFRTKRSLMASFEDELPECSARAEAPRAYAAAAEESPPSSPIRCRQLIPKTKYATGRGMDALDAVVGTDETTDYLSAIAAIYRTSSVQLTLENGASIQIQLQHTGRKGQHSNFYKIVDADRAEVPISSHISNQLLCAKVIRRENFTIKSNLTKPEKVWLPNSETQYNYLKKEGFPVIAMDFGYWRHSGVVFVEEATPIDRPLWSAQESLATLLATPHSNLSTIVDFFLFGYRSSCEVPLDLKLDNLGYTQTGNLVLLDCMEHTTFTFPMLASNCLSTFINRNIEVEKYIVNQLQNQGFHWFKD